MAIRSVRAKTAHEQHDLFSLTASSGSAPADDRSSATRRRRMWDAVLLHGRRALSSYLLAGSAAAMVLSSAGCSMISNAYKQARQCDCLDDFMIAHRNRTFALKAWYRERDCFRNQPHLDEFKAGFLAGYMEIAEGGDGCSPCTAPSQYWGWRYQSADGQAAIDAWFAGFPLGVKAAEMDGVGYWGYMHQANSVPAQESAEPSEPAEQPIPAEPVTPIYGPDGRLIPPGQELKEYIVPGTERVVPQSELDALSFGTGSEMLEQSAFSSSTPSTPPADASIATLPATNLTFPATNTGTTSNTSTFEDAATLVPATGVANDTKIYSLDDLEDLDELGDEAIEDIFGSVEMIESPAETSPTANDGLILPAATSEAKTADADQGIPFKFE